MHPLLFEIPVLGGIRIYTYGALVASAFMIGILWTVHEGKLEGIKFDLVMDLSFYIIIAALAGSRILYIIVDYQRYLDHPIDALKIWEGGLVFYGGLIAAMLTSFYYLRKHRTSFLLVADLFMPGVALAHAIGRLGCFAAGCCYGREAPGFPLAVVFPQSPLSLAPTGIPLYPSQLLESATELLIFFILVFLRRRKSFNGQIFLIYLVLYGVSRSILETFRGDSIRGYIIPHWITTSQLISGLLIAGCLLLYLRLRKKTRGVPA